MRFFMLGGTRRNTHYIDKPNEDLYIIDSENNAVILLDGVTRDRVNGVYPNPSPSRQISEIFAEAAMKSIIETKAEQDATKRLTLAAQKGNAAVAEANKNFNDPFLPGTVGIMAIFNEDCLYYAYIGDSVGMVIGKSKAECFTVPQTAEVHRRSKEFTALEIRTKICNNAAHPCGYGVWNGQKESDAFLRTGVIKLNEGDKVLICSDGIEPYLKTVTDETLYAMGGEGLINAALEFTLQDRWMDDRTAVVVEVK